jgi:hypothetical protein
MSTQVPTVRRVIGVEEHAWTVELRDALLRFGGDDTVTMLSSQLRPKASETATPTLFTDLRLGSGATPTGIS